jgi:alanine dehydrogenase
MPFSFPLQRPCGPRLRMSASQEQPLWISESDVVSVMDLADAIGALETGLLAEAAGKAENMLKTHVEWDGSTLHAIGAVFSEAGLCGTKTWAHTANGATPLLVLFDTANGSLRAIIEAFALGQMRTAAASGVATRWLAGSDADTLGMIGTGKQALAQVAAVVAVRPIRTIRLFGRNKVRRDEFVNRLRSEFEVEVLPSDSIREAIADASVVSIATRATEPIVTADMLQSGAHINSVGAIVPSRAEIAQDVVARSTHIATDSVPQARILSRELMEFFGPETSNWERVRPLASVIASRFQRSDADDLTLFKALGVGISDLALGIEIYRKALANGLGRPLPTPKRASPRLSRKVEVLD